MKRMLLPLALAALMLLAGCGEKEAVLTITAEFAPPARVASTLTVATDKDFSDEQTVALESKSGRTGVYTVTVPGKTKTLYVRPVVTRVGEALAEPVSCVIGEDETGTILLDGAEWITVEAGKNPNDGDWPHCLILRTTPGSDYLGGDSYILTTPDGKVQTERDCDAREPGEKELDTRGTTAFLRFWNMDEPGCYAGCTLTIDAVRVRSTENQPALSCDGADVVIVDR